MDITSRDNRWIREYRHLVADGKYRRRSGLFALEGARLCADAVLSEVSLEVVLYTAQGASRYPEQLALLHRVAQCFEIAEQLASFISDTEAPQGIFCIGRMKEEDYTPDLLLPSGRYAALEAVQDPGNLGTMIRTAEALGLDGLLLSDGCCDVYNPKVLRGSMGGVFRLPLFSVGPFDRQFPLLHRRGFTTVACVVDTDAIPIQQAPLSSGTVVVIGNEGNGLTPKTVAACTCKTTIPMVGRAESLNASMAAGIVFWEMMRRTDG